LLFEILLRFVNDTVSVLDLKMSKELVDQAVNTLRRGLPFIANGIQYTLDTVDSLLECGRLLSRFAL